MKCRFAFWISLVVGLTFAGCAPREPDPTAPILLFNGTGTSPGDVKAVESLLRENHLTFTTANAAQLNGMTEAQLRGYRLMIIPGGNYLTIGNGLTTTATTNVRAAVHAGVNYLGICAGGILAGHAQVNSFNLTSGVRFDFYRVVNQGIHKASVPITTIDGPVLEHYWEDGPQLTGWGAVVAKYPDDTPAVVEGKSGEGWVILCGVHPEAPESWRRGMNFTTPASTDQAYAVRLIVAALERTNLPHY